MKPKVLIVDDEPDVLESTGLLIQALGYEALSVSDPGEILETVERERPGLILQDLKMPGLNVAGLVAALRLNPKTAEVPLVFFSAGSDLATTSARYDAWGFLAKPFGRAELARLLSQVLGAPGASPMDAPSRDMQREVRAIFHDYWNLLAALSNYIILLGEAENLPPAARKSVKGLDELIMKLESKTDRLSTYIRALVNSLEALPTARTGQQPVNGP